jgi:hypothetical protein
VIQFAEDYEGISQYDFTGAPPIKPKLFFTEKGLVSAALWGGYPNPQRTIFPGDNDGAMGRWTHHFDIIDPLSEEAMKEPWKLLAQLLPGTRMRWHDWDIDKSWLWVLTDQVIHRHGYDHDLRLGVWPD